MEQHPDARKWNQRYRESKHTPVPCELLREQAHLLPGEGTALDLACGLGGNSLFLAQQGMTVHAWDISDVAINRLADHHNDKILTEIRDIITAPPPPDTFDCIVVSFFLHRQLCPAIAAALRPGGVLFYQTFTRDKLSSKGPSNRDFLLENNELLHLFRDLEVRFYQENARCGDSTRGDRDTASLVAQKPAR